MLLNSRDKTERNLWLSWIPSIGPLERNPLFLFLYFMNFGFLLTSFWKTGSTANLCMSSEVWERKKKLHFYECGLKFWPGKPCFKACGCSDAKPVKSLGYSELPPKNLFEMLTLLVNGRQYSSQLPNIFGSNWKTEYKDCGSRQTSSDSNRTNSFIIWHNGIFLWRWSFTVEHCHSL